VIERIFQSRFSVFGGQYQIIFGKLSPLR
jgi:hypothetical protein